MKEITPRSIVNDKEIAALIPAIDEQLNAMKLDAPYLDVKSLAENVLDMLAVQYHVDFYDTAATIETKRAMISSALLWHMKKGTSAAIIQALKLIGIDAEFLHWHDTGDPPYTFRIKAEITGDYYRTAGRDKIIALIRNAVDQSKAARSVMIGLDTSINFTEQNNFYVGIIPVLSGQEIIKPEKILLPSENNFYVAEIAALSGHKIIKPDRLRAVSCKIYAGIVRVENISISIGVDLKIMQELLLQYEKRIFARLENLQAAIMSRIDLETQKINTRIDELEDLLIWKGDEE